MSLLAEDLFVLLVDAESGRPLVDGIRFPRALAGAILLELALDETVGIGTGGDGGRKGRVVVRDVAEPADELLADAVRRLGSSKPMKPTTVVEKFSKGVREKLASRAVAHGRVREEARTLLGVFPARRWPAADGTYREQLRERIRSAVVEGGAPDTRTAALIALLSAADAVPKILPGENKRAVRRRAKEIAAGEWAAKAVRDAVNSIDAALLVAVTASVGVAGS